MLLGVVCTVIGMFIRLDSVFITVKQILSECSRDIKNMIETVVLVRKIESLIINSNPA